MLSDEMKAEIRRYMDEMKAEMEAEDMEMSDEEMNKMQDDVESKMEDEVTKMDDDDDMMGKAMANLPAIVGDVLNETLQAREARKSAQRSIVRKARQAQAVNDPQARKSQFGMGEDSTQKIKGMPHFRMGEPEAPSIGKALIELYQQKVHGIPTKNVSYQIGSNSGFLLDNAVSEQFIEVLRDRLILRQLGADMITMDGQETLTLPKDRTEHTAYWVGEGTEIPTSDETVGGVTLYPKPLAARIVVPNKFLSNTRINYESRVQEKAQYRINRALEFAALFGAGGTTGTNTGIEPAGLATLAGVADRDVTLTTLGSGNGAKPKLSDIEDMIGRVEDANVMDDGTFAFALSPRAKRFFGNMKDADGNYILRSRASEGIDPNFLSYRYSDSNLIPNNQKIGSNSDATTLFFGRFSDLKIGMSNQVEFIIDPYSRSSRLETVIIAHMYADVAVAHDESFEVLNGARV